MPQGSGDELLTKSFRDYTHHLMQRMVRESGMRQFYYDIAFASKIYHNLSGGHGYFLPDGRIQPEMNDDELRQFMIRSYAMMQENGIYPTGISGHATNAFCLKALPFMDAILDAEYPIPSFLALCHNPLIVRKDIILFGHYNLFATVSLKRFIRYFTPSFRYISRCTGSGTPVCLI